MLDRVVVAALAVALSGCGGLRRVGDGAWRSGQPDPEDLRFLARAHRVRTVVSLRSPAPGRDWYERELAVCRELGVEHVSLGWSARAVSDEQVDELVRVFETYPGPYLLHCRSGKDRTSLAAAVYRLVVLGHDPEAADDEMRVFPHGHVPWFGFEAIDRAWRRFLARRRSGALSPGASPGGGRRGRGDADAAPPVPRPDRC